MGSYPGVGTPYVNQGGAEAQIGDDALAIPMTIDGARLGTALANVTVKGPSLFGRRTAAPNKLVPLVNGTAIINPTNTTNATVDIADADAVKYRVGDLLTFYDVSTGLFSAETKTLDIIGAAGSGGTGETLLTFTGEVWTTPPVATDILVVADGAQLSANAVLINEDVVFDGSTDKGTKGYIKGTFQKSKVGNTTYFTQADNQVLKLVDTQ